MTRQDAQRLLAELSDLEVRAVVAGTRLPGDDDVAQLRRDIQARRAHVIELLATWSQLDPADDTYAGATRH